MIELLIDILYWKELKGYIATEFYSHNTITVRPEHYIGLLPQGKSELGIVSKDNVYLLREEYLKRWN